MPRGSGLLDEIEPSDEKRVPGNNLIEPHDTGRNHVLCKKNTTRVCSRRNVGLHVAFHTS